MAKGTRSGAGSRTGVGRRRDPRRPRLRSLLLVVLVLVLVGGAAAGAWRYGLLDEWFDDDVAVPPDPAAVAPPSGLDLAPVTAPGPVAEEADGPAARRADVAAALRPYLRSKSLGPHVLAQVASLDGDSVIFDRGSGGATPASNTKLVTTTAALLALGADHTFETTVRAEAKPDGTIRRVVLVGGGDPYLARTPDPASTGGAGGEEPRYPARSDVEDLAAQTAAALKEDGVRAVQVGYDDSLFAGPAVNSHWESGYVPSEVAPTSALWVDGARAADGSGRVADPARDAARSFDDALTDAGIRVRGALRQVTSDDGDDELASVDSPPLSQIVERILQVSDNDGAEVLLRQVGLAEGGDGSIASGRRGVRSVLGDAGLGLGSSVLHDGSGLARDNVLEPRVLLGVLRLAASADHPEARSVLTGLPVAGFSGSLATRMGGGDPAGLGRVRAKTGTLSGVFTLAGVAVDRDGTPLVFALMADRVPAARAGEGQATLDDAAAALGACRCG